MVLITQRSSETRQTAASSSVSLPTISSGGAAGIGSRDSTSDSDPAGSLQAQPAPWDSSVRRTGDCSIVIAVITVAGCPISIPSRRPTGFAS